MQNKKSLLGYISVSVTGVALCIYLYTLLVSLCALYEEISGKRYYVFDIPLSSIISVAVIFMAAMIFVVLSKLKAVSKIKGFTPDSTWLTVVYYIIFALILGLSLFFNIRIMLNGEMYSGVSSYMHIFFVYENGTVIGGSICAKLFGALSLALLKVFGDIYFIPVLLNICFLSASGVLFASVTRMLFGRCEALTILGLFLLLDRPAKLVIDCSGISLFIFAMAFIAFTASFFLELIVERKPVVVKSVFVILTIGFGVAYHFLCSPFSLDVLSYPVIENYHISSYYGGIIPVCLLALFGLISFFYDTKDRITLSVYVLLLTVVASLFTTASEYTYIFVLFTGAILAGHSIRWLLFKTDVTADSEETETVSDDGKEQPLDASNVVTKVPEPSENKTSEETVILVEDTVKVPEKVEITETTPVNSEKAEEKISEPVIAKKPRYLDNPLPVPKRHVKKKIDYAFEPAPSLMKYDVEVSDNDDFDIR